MNRRGFMGSLAGLAGLGAAAPHLETQPKAADKSPGPIHPYLPYELKDAASTVQLNRLTHTVDEDFRTITDVEYCLTFKGVDSQRVARLRELAMRSRGVYVFSTRYRLRPTQLNVIHNLYENRAVMIWGARYKEMDAPGQVTLRPRKLAAHIKVPNELLAECSTAITDYCTRDAAGLVG